MTRVHLRPGLGPNESGPHELGPTRTWPNKDLTNKDADQQGSGPRPPPGGRPALLTLVGLSLAACITVAALLVLLLSYGDGPTLIVARWAPQPVSTPPLPPENLPSPAQPAPSTFQVAAAESAPAQAPPPPPQATTLAQTAPQDAAPTAPAALPDQTQLLQTMARDLANLERTIEQLKANQQQVASDNSKAIEELKASQEEIKRVLAKVTEQSPPRRQPPSNLRRSRLRPYAGPSGRRRRGRGLDTRGSGCTTIGSRRSGEPPFINDTSRNPGPVAYWNATSAKLLSLRECSRSRSWDLSFSSARRPISRCWPTRWR